jgi:hypothetical protein
MDKRFKPLVYEYNDGGRKASGHKGRRSDCVSRAIALALDLPYKEVWDYMTYMVKDGWSDGSTANGGVPSKIYGEFLEDRGWKGKWFDGHDRKPLRLFKPPYKNMIVKVKPRNTQGSHLVCIKDGKVLDSWNCLKSKKHYYVLKIYYKMNRAQRKNFRDYMRRRNMNPKWDYVKVPRKKKEAK